MRIHLRCLMAYSKLVNWQIGFWRNYFQAHDLERPSLLDTSPSPLTLAFSLSPILGFDMANDIYLRDINQLASLLLSPSNSFLSIAIILDLSDTLSLSFVKLIVNSTTICPLESLLQIKAITLWRALLCHSGRPLESFVLILSIFCSVGISELFLNSHFWHQMCGVCSNTTSPALRHQLASLQFNFILTLSTWT